MNDRLASRPGDRAPAQRTANGGDKLLTILVGDIASIQQGLRFREKLLVVRVRVAAARCLGRVVQLCQPSCGLGVQCYRRGSGGTADNTSGSGYGGANEIPAIGHDEAGSVITWR